MMWDRLRRWLNDVPIHGSVARSQAPLFQLMVISVFLAVALRVVAFLLTLDETSSAWLDLGMGALILAILVSAFSILRFGHFHFAVFLTTAGFMLGLAIILVNTGLHSSGIVPFAFALPITLAGLLAGRRTLLLTAMLSIAIVATTAFLELQVPPLSGLSPLPNPPEDMALTFTMITVLLVIFLG